MATPHIQAEKGDFAQTVLMPGDPLRAKFMAETYLEKVRQVNAVRGMLGYTGVYQGQPVSVMASGMGMPSMGIYSYELFRFYDVENIIRIGTAGAVSEQLSIGDVVLAMSAATNSNYAAQYRLPGTPAPTADFSLLQAAHQAALERQEKVYVGSVFFFFSFYDDADSLRDWQKIGVLAVEMECAALYLNAARLGKKALAICTISDCPFTGESSSSAERQTSFRRMMEIGLQTAITAQK